MQIKNRQRKAQGEFLLHCSRSYAIAVLMFARSHPVCLSLCAFALFTACAMPAKKRDVLDLYDLPHTSAAPVARPMPVDNDSYYTQPAVYQGCTMINDAPSCGGG